jgi:hypothetical protein
MLTHRGKGKSFLDPLWPMCAVCNKRVEMLEWYSDFQTREVIVKAICHQRIDECRLTPEVLIFEALRPGYAFSNKDIDYKETKLLGVEGGEIIFDEFNHDAI